MTPSIERFRPQDRTQDIVAAIRETGVVIIEQMVDPEATDLLRTKINSALEDMPFGTSEMFGSARKSMGEIFGRGREFSEHLLTNDKILEVVDEILLPEVRAASSARPVEPKYGPDSSTPEAVAAWLRGPDPKVGPNCHHYRINATVAMQVWKGGQDQDLHKDKWRYLPHWAVPEDAPDLTIATMFAAVDFTTENGATRFAPGSNKWEPDRFPEPHEIVQAEMPKGSTAHWLGTVFHGWGTNRTEEPRTGIIFSFVVDRLQQEENQFLAVPPAKAIELSEKAQQLLGYRSSPAINWVVGRSAENMLREGESLLS